MKLDDQVKQDFEAHVLAEYPKEACGLVVNAKYIACKNVANEPERDFEISAIDFLSAKSQGSIQAVLHSHPYKSADKQLHPPEWPSTADMKAWMGNNIPWGIVATDGEGFTRYVWLDEEHPEPLLGREFIHGVNDCYSLLRDWFKEVKGITLKNFPRGYGWWDFNQNLYEDNFAIAGFEEVPFDQAQVGDCLLMKLGGRVIHHAAVITGNNEITHHVFHRPSKTDSLNKWASSIVKVVRYNPALLTKD